MTFAVLLHIDSILFPHPFYDHFSSPTFPPSFLGRQCILIFLALFPTGGAEGAPQRLQRCLTAGSLVELCMVLLANGQPIPSHIPSLSPIRVLQTAAVLIPA